MIEDLKQYLGDDRLHVGIGKVKRLHMAPDRSFLKVSMDVFPELREIIATMTWENVGPDSGEFEFPTPGDMVLFVQAEGDDDQAYIIKRLTSKEDTIPAEASTGDKVHRAKAGKKYWNISDSKIFLSRNGTAPTENLVLGQVFKTYSQNLLLEIKKILVTLQEETHVGNLGYDTSPPNQASDYADNQAEIEGFKASPIDSEDILSDLSYTEK